MSVLKNKTNNYVYNGMTKIGISQQVLRVSFYNSDKNRFDECRFYNGVTETDAFKQVWWVYFYNGVTQTDKSEQVR